MESEEPLRLSPQCLKVCGFPFSGNEECGRSFSSAYKLREHLRKTHRIGVEKASNNSTAKEREAATKSIRQYFHGGIFHGTKFADKRTDKAMIVSSWFQKHDKVSRHRQQLAVGSDPCSKLYSNQIPFSIVFVPLDQLQDDINVYQNLAIPATEDADFDTICRPWFTKERIQELKAKFGTGFATEADRLYLHQGIAIMEILRHCFRREMGYCSKIELLQSLHAGGIRCPEPGATLVVVFLYYTGCGVSRNELNDIFEATDNYAVNKFGSLRTFPRRKEVLWDESKTSDIKVLDAVAEAAEDPRCKYRPITCAGYSLCPLRDHLQTVVKRSWSCGSQHVRIINTPSKKLICSRSGAIQRPAKLGKSDQFYFHQEFINSFQQIGEFRVFIVCENDPASLRRRAGRIVHTIITRFETQGSNELRAINVDATDSYWIETGLSCQDLHRFALFIFEHLRRRDDWESHYESLEIGARLDIAISDQSSSFFVNEITRWYKADFFSQSTCGPPYTQLCSLYARAFDEYFAAKETTGSSSKVS